MATPEENRAYQRAHYHANKELWRRKRMRYEAKMRALILADKDRPCGDCGLNWPAIVMEHDHRPGTVKKFNLGDGAARRRGEKAIREEMAKCDVLCPTCHRIRTFIRLGLLPASCSRGRIRDLKDRCCSSTVERRLGKAEVSGFKSQQQLSKS